MAINCIAKDGVSTITLDRPNCLNALNIEHLEALVKHLAAFENDLSTRAIVIAGKGPSFCAGADIKAMQRMTPAEFAHATSLYSALARLTRRLPQAIIGALHGYVLGGGLELALWCDLRMCAKNTTFGLPDAALGFTPTGGLTQRLTDIIGLSRSMDMVLTTRHIDDQTALNWGLVSQICPPDTLHQLTTELATIIATRPKNCIADCKRLLYDNQYRSFNDVLQSEEYYDNKCFNSEELSLHLPPKI